jgi:hypothetical protein
MVRQATRLAARPTSSMPTKEAAARSALEAIAVEAVFGAEMA